MADGFLGRWSRRKLDERAGLPLEEPVPVVPAPQPAAVAAPVDAGRQVIKKVRFSLPWLVRRDEMGVIFLLFIKNE